MDPLTGIILVVVLLALLWNLEQRGGRHPVNILIVGFIVLVIGFILVNIPELGISKPGTVLAELDSVIDSFAKTIKNL